MKYSLKIHWHEWTYYDLFCWARLTLYLHTQQDGALSYARHLCPCVDCAHSLPGEKVCGCRRASCGSFPLGWHAGVVLCHRADLDIMWVYQVATRVSGSVWVTEGLLILKLYHFFFSLAVEGMARAWRYWTTQSRLSISDEMMKCVLLDLNPSSIDNNCNSWKLITRKNTQAL